MTLADTLFLLSGLSRPETFDLARRKFLISLLNLPFFAAHSDFGKAP